MISTLLLLTPALLNTPEPNPAVLRDRIEKWVTQAESRDAEVGLVVYSVQRGEYLYRKNPNRKFTAASNSKLITTAAALSLLGSDYLFETKFWANGEIKDGVLEGDLWVEGGGDPCFSGVFFNGDALSPLESCAAALKRQGIKKINGDLVLNDRIFDREFVAPQWPKDQLSLEYCAPICGLSLNEGCLDIEILPGNAGKKPSARIFPTGASFSVINEMETESGRGDPKLDFSFTNEGALRLRGSIRAQSGSYKGRLTVPSPLDFFGAALKNVFQQENLAVQGRTRAVGDKEELPSSAKILYRHRSPILNAIQLANKESSNFCSEHLIKTIGAVIEKDGSWSGGTRAVKQFIKKLGISENEIAMEDGSGLSRGNQFSPELFVTLLTKVYQSSFREMYLNSLPISGVDGTLKNRMTQRPYKGNVRAKTGWIHGASSLTGYVTSQTGEVFVFSILINYKGNTNNRVFKEIEDGICSELVEMGRELK